MELRNCLLSTCVVHVCVCLCAYVWLPLNVGVLDGWYGWMVWMFPFCMCPGSRQSADQFLIVNMSKLYAITVREYAGWRNISTFWEICKFTLKMKCSGGYSSHVCVLSTELGSVQLPWVSISYWGCQVFVCVQTKPTHACQRCYTEVLSR